MTCTSCRREIADNSSFCPFCGTAQPSGVQGGPAPSSLPGAPPSSAPVASSPAPGWSGSTPGVQTGGPAPDQGKAVMALLLGIGGILLDLGGCCCFGVPSLAGIGLGVAAFIMGRNELEDIAGGFVSRESEGMANGAKIVGIIGIILGAICFVGGVAMALLGALGPKD